MAWSASSVSETTRLPFSRTINLESVICAKFLVHEIIAGGILKGGLQSSWEVEPMMETVSTG